MQQRLEDGRESKAGCGRSLVPLLRCMLHNPLSPTLLVVFNLSAAELYLFFADVGSALEKRKRATIRLHSALGDGLAFEQISTSNCFSLSQMEPKGSGCVQSCISWSNRPRSSNQVLLCSTSKSDTLIDFPALRIMYAGIHQGSLTLKCFVHSLLFLVRIRCFAHRTTAGGLITAVR